MTILACDPSLTAYGWAVLDGARVIAAGCIRVKLARSRGPKTAASAARLAALTRELDSALCAAAPTSVVAELPMGGKHAGTAKALAQSFAVTVAVCALRGVPLSFVTPMAAKRAATGRPDADKDAVAAGVYERTGWRSTASSKPAREAEADAVAVGLTALAAHDALRAKVASEWRET